MKKSKIELERKVIHLIFGVVLSLAIYNGVANGLILASLTIAAFVLFWCSKFTNIWPMEWVLNRFERPDVRKTFPGKGSLFYLIGAVFSVILFPKDVAAASIMILAVGDSVPKLFGILVSEGKLPSKKTLYGGIAMGIAVSFLFASFMLRWEEALVSSIVAVYLGTMDIGIDDNLIVPLSAGFIILAVRLILP
ncbi:hypothetical protein J4401_07310 [Candidatus Woesearchaeota archaeon]|nr:hypothetical protein [Candidatus Woesearchaeota archaeon]